MTDKIYIIDDDMAVRDALSALFSLEGFQVLAFESGDKFLEQSDRLPPACILLDIRMPGRSGLEVLQELTSRGYKAPVFMISGHGDIPVAVRAMKAGAVDFIEKPFNAETVVGYVREALAGLPQTEPETESRLAGLTRRESEVLGKIAAGKSSKETARELGVSPRTVETHRARIMAKLKAKNAADLVRIALAEGGIS